MYLRLEKIEIVNFLESEHGSTEEKGTLNKNAEGESDSRPQGRRQLSLVLRAAGIVAIIAGMIFILSGYTSHPILLTILSYVEDHFSKSLTSSELYVLTLSISILNFLVSLGGIVVIVGGFLLLMRRRTFGRILIWFGGGMGILGLLFTIGEAFYYAGFSLVVFHSEYWIGLLLSTFSFVLAKRGK